MRLILTVAVAVLWVALLGISEGQGQAILQGGAAVGGRVPMYSPNMSSIAGAPAYLMDSGPAGGWKLGQGVNELLQVNRFPGTGPGGAHNCMYDNADPTQPLHYLCLEPNVNSSGGLIEYGAANGASPLPLTCNVNGIATQCVGSVVSGMAVVPNLAALKALNPTTNSQVRRLGYASPGDGGAADYFASTTACSLNGGAGDNGSQVPALGGGCWNGARNASYYVRVWGATCDGVTDDHVAIQAAVNAAGAAGNGRVIIPGPSCYIGTGNPGIQVGNGTDGLASSYGGVLLVGEGAAGSAIAIAEAAGVPRLLYGGNGSAVKIAGPLQGWGVQHLRIDCTLLTSGSSVGLLVTSAKYGVSGDLSIQNCYKDLLSTTVLVPPPGDVGGETNSNNNAYTGLQLVIGQPGTANVDGITAIQLSGGVNGGTVIGDTFFNTFDNVIIEPCATNSITENGIYVDVSDSNRFKDVLIGKCTSPLTTLKSIVLDWSKNTNFPAGDLFDRVDTTPTRAGTIPYTFIGSPVAGTQEWFINGTNTNGDYYPTPQVGVYVDRALGAWTPTLVGGTTAGTGTYTTQAGNYYSSGLNMQVYFVIAISGFSTSPTGNFQITGLPLPMGNATLTNASCQLSFMQGWNSAVAGVSQVVGEISNGQTYITLYEIGNNATALSAVASWTAPIKIIGQCNYTRL